MEKLDIKSMSLDELKQQMKELGLPAFRAGQVYSWLHCFYVDDFEQMTNLSKDLRAKLAERYYINSLSIKRKLVSAIDGTVKYLYELKDGNCVEAVLMKYKHGSSLCISTQVGCKMGCKFCASTLAGWVRNLTPSEMLDEIYYAVKDSGQRVDSLVLMGIGEPLDNFDNVTKFLELLRSPEGYNLSLRHVTLSTCGLVERIYDLADKDYQLTLAVSLHAPNNEMRSRTMPVNDRYAIEKLIQACRDYFKKTGRRITFEYALIAGVNDSIQAAEELSTLLKGLPCHINLIPVNEVKERGLKRSGAQAIRDFQNTLGKLGLNATIRRELGSDISAACGQLRREEGMRREEKQ
ncbi:MAG: 23S rRNA (adenine(2503)-C(2))-methyltransferase RlmN [Oscillospiraceae bacterium]|nr:23S rRNA (adenine(2503)-C(2))-methyltransferase RlmN [Oscillospiraceae bacterium]